MTCKDCLHLSACKNLLDTLQIVMDENAENREKHCKTFENQEEYVNLPVFPTIKILDKQIPKKPIGDLHSVPHFRCPVCKNGVKTYTDSAVYPYCHHCGQALDWSDYE